MTRIDEIKERLKDSPLKVENIIPFMRDITWLIEEVDKYEAVVDAAKKYCDSCNSKEYGEEYEEALAVKIELEKALGDIDKQQVTNEYQVGSNGTDVVKEAKELLQKIGKKQIDWVLPDKTNVYGEYHFVVKPEWLPIIVTQDEKLKDLGSQLPRLIQQLVERCERMNNMINDLAADKMIAEANYQELKNKEDKNN